MQNFEVALSVQTEGLKMTPGSSIRQKISSPVP